MEYRSTRPSKIPTAHSIRPSVRWLPPPVDWYKANFNAIIFQDDGRASLGVIIHDSNGSTMVSLSQNIQLSNSVVEVEAMAASRAIELSLELGFDKIIFKVTPRLL